MSDDQSQLPLCELRYYMNGVTTSQRMTVTTDGMVRVTGEVEIEGVDEVEVYCETHKCMLLGGVEHYGVTLDEYWEAI